MENIIDTFKKFFPEKMKKEKEWYDKIKSSHTTTEINVTEILKEITTYYSLKNENNRHDDLTPFEIPELEHKVVTYYDDDNFSIKFDNEAMKETCESTAIIKTNQCYEMDRK